MRKTLEKYNLDYEYTERERELFNAGEKDKLIVVYEGGKVVLMIKKQTKDYATQARLYIQYRDSDTAKKFYESNMPKRATSDDF